MATVTTSADKAEPADEHRIEFSYCAVGLFKHVVDWRDPNAMQSTLAWMRRIAGYFNKEAARTEKATRRKQKARQHSDILPRPVMPSVGKKGGA